MSDEVRSLTVLGSGGFHPAYERETMCFLVERAQAQPLLLDAGTGMRRLAEPPLRDRFAAGARLDIVLSHFHQDHIVGLTYLPGVWQGPVRIWAPQQPLVDAPAGALQRLVRPPFFPTPLESFPNPVEIRLYDSDFEVDGLEIRVRRQKHPGGSVGLRLGNSLAYVTDTAIQEQTVDLAADVELLIHEVWCDRGEAAENPKLLGGHSCGEDVVDVALRARARKLLPVHHHPKRDHSELDAFLRQLRVAVPEGERLDIQRAIDGDTLDLSKAADTSRHLNALDDPDDRDDHRP